MRLSFKTQLTRQNTNLLKGEYIHTKRKSRERGKEARASFSTLHYVFSKESGWMRGDVEGKGDRTMERKAACRGQIKEELAKKREKGMTAR